MAARGLTATDAVTALQQQNVEIAAGQLGAPPIDAKQQYQIAVNVIGRLTSPEQFDNIVLKNTPMGCSAEGRWICAAWRKPMQPT